LENIKPTLGPVQTFRITQASYYRALELGINHDQAVELLERSSQHALPANVLQTLQDWAGRRESMVVHTKTSLVGFPSTAARDAYLAKGQGRACGERWVIVDKSQDIMGPDLAEARTLDRWLTPKTLFLDEQGAFSHREPLDAVQIGRLHHFAERSGSQWRITSTSMKTAVQHGIQPAVIFGWLEQMLEDPIPPLLEHALHAWTGKPRHVEHGNAIVLSVGQDELFTTVAQSELVKPMLLGTLGPGWLLVRPECAKELARLLGEYGFAVTKGVTPEILPTGTG
jgi:hypothetical protein